MRDALVPSPGHEPVREICEVLIQTPEQKWKDPTPAFLKSIGVSKLNLESIVSVQKMAPGVGIEPTSAVLETVTLPLS